MTDSFSSRYAALVASGKIEADPAQAELARHYIALDQRLTERLLARKSSSLGWLFAKKAKVTSVRGLYVHGEVGRGKTMLMDLFFGLATEERKRRAHFHVFMADIHGRVHRVRREIQEGRRKGDDPIVPVADEIASETRLLCFDEFAVTDIADAMILGRLFTRLFEKGVVVVATSNVAPDDLYRDGINRGHFLPFIALLKKHVEVVRLAARTDFRLEKLAQAPVYVTPLGPVADAAMDAAWTRLTGVSRGAPTTLPVQGREVVVPQAEKGVARFDFEDLCARPLGPGDYLALAHSFHTVVIDHVPVLDEARRNEAKRFITLIDALYDGHVKLVLSAAAEPEGLYTADTGTEAFEFARTASRLVEMRSEDYLSKPHRAFIAET